MVRTVSFGQRGASDFTKHKNTDRQEAYTNKQKERGSWAERYENCRVLVC